MDTILTTEWLILRPEDISESAFAHLARQWPVANVWFLADNILNRLDCEQFCPTGWQLESIAALMDQAVSQLRTDYLNLDRQLGLTDRHRDWWECSAVADRNPNSSDILLTAARLQIIETAVLADNQPPLQVIIAEPRFARFLYRRLRQESHQIILRKLKYGNRFKGFLQSFSQALRWKVKAWRAMASFAICFLRRKVTLRTLRRMHPIPVATLRQAEILLINWGRPDSFAGGLSDYDPFLGELPAQLKTAGLPFGFLTQPLWWVTDFTQTARNALHSGAPMLFIEDLLSVFDVLRAVAEALWLPHRLRRLLNGRTGVLADAVRFDLPRLTSQAAAVYPTLLQGLGRGLRRLQIMPRFIVHPYENQPWEKTLRQGVRRYLSSTQLIGVMHAPFPRVDVSYLPSRSDILLNRCPDVIETLGQLWQDAFLKQGFPKARLDIIGALRFGRMLEAPSPATPPPLKFLCCNGINLSESIELCLTAARATAGLDTVRLVINFHPLSDKHFRSALQSALQHYARCSLDHVIYSPLGIRDLMTDCHAVFYENTAAAFDAAWNGRHLVHIGSQSRLNLDTMVENVAQEPVNPSALRQLVEAWVAAPPEDNRAIVRQRISHALGEIAVTPLIKRFRTAQEINGIG